MRKAKVSAGLITAAMMKCAQQKFGQPKMDALAVYIRQAEQAGLSASGTPSPCRQSPSRLPP